MALRARRVPGACDKRALGWSPGRGHRVAFLGKTFDSYVQCLSPPRPANCWGNPTNCGGVTCDGLASRPGGVEILLAASCHRIREIVINFAEMNFDKMQVKLFF